MDRKSFIDEAIRAGTISKADGDAMLATPTVSIAGAISYSELGQGSAVSDASGGATVDSEARTAINGLLSELRTLGIIAT